jgi:Helicase conserved C-terminal domain
MVNWVFPESITLHGGDILAEDAERQSETAKAILSRFESQPGVVLADDVGMGKTFVALAVATSVLTINRNSQVVVMVPPAVKDKWPSDWRTFKAKCLSENETHIRHTETAISDGLSFLKLLDDPEETRTHLIFVTHGALKKGATDSFTMLAAVRQAMWHRPSLSQQRKVFPRFAAELLKDRRFDEKTVRRLMDAPPSDWRAVWNHLKSESDQLADDPVPADLVASLTQANLEKVRVELENLPLKRTAGLPQRLKTVRNKLKPVLRETWRQSLNNVSARLPLLILDEAHHAKNSNRLRELFVAGKSAEEDTQPSLNNVFDRMLLLTATPFQLGHEELIRVMEIFSSVHASKRFVADFNREMSELSRLLEKARTEMIRVDTVWGMLSQSDQVHQHASWWKRDDLTLQQNARMVADAISSAKSSLADVEKILSKWVIRHTKPRRRREEAGRSIISPDNAGDGRGIPLDESTSFPFLMASRAQAVAREHGLSDHTKVRQYFGEGLASSYETYKATRQGQEVREDSSEESAHANLPEAVQWYLGHVDQSIPTEDLGRHPKVNAVVRRAIDLWEDGEKVVIFTFFRQTGRALRRHISDALLDRIVQLAVERDPSLNPNPEVVLDALATFSESALRKGRPGHTKLFNQVVEIGLTSGCGRIDAENIAEFVIRYLRTPASVVRFMQFDLPPQKAMDKVLESVDGSGVSLRRKVEIFSARVANLAEENRPHFWQSLERTTTGAIRQRVNISNQGEFEEDESVSVEDMTLLPNVRLANGSTSREVRQRMTEAFNTPFLPEILISSSVLAEGVDLHRECRYVIHHDLDWNPSNLEQRVGRVDRISSKSQVSGAPIVVFSPFIAGAQDERQYKVVTDRDKWFGVVMGGRVPESEDEVDRISLRAEVPDELLRDLSLDLSVWKSATSASFGNPDL